jgi:hypothetical protein
MFPTRAYGLLWGLAKDLHKTQGKTLVAVCASFARSGRARSFEVARQLAQRAGIRLKSALGRYYRWVGHSALDPAKVWCKLAGRLLVAAGRRPVVAVDWTEWHSGLRVLAAGVCLGKRAVPVLARALVIATIRRSQNAFEQAFLTQLRALSPLMEKTVLVFDRGFRRVSLICQLQYLHQPFVLRLIGKVHVTLKGYQGLLSAYPLRPGQWVDLGMVQLRQHHPVRVRIVGVWAAHQKGVWWLATSLSTSVKDVVGCYDRRMTVEEMFRDSKGNRYGMQLFWTRFARPEQLDRLFLLAAIAIAIWTAAGALTIQADPSAALFSRTKGPRRSLVNIGRLEPERIIQLFRSTWSYLVSLLLPAKARAFGWIT